MCAKRSESSQDFIPVKNIRHGIIETVDDRYLKILEIEPINFMLRSDEEQLGRCACGYPAEQGYAEKYPSEPVLGIFL